MARKLLAAATLLLGGCNWYYNSVPSPDALLEAIPWFDHMIKSKAVSPYQRADVPRTTVPGTVPITGGEADWRAEFVSNNPATADRLVNPLAPADTPARADTLYQTFCATCHGPVGAGDGLVGRRLGAKSLLTDAARGRSDGYIYSIIRYGFGGMPRYGDKVVRAEDRWAIVNYVRRLQGAGGAAVPAGGTRP
jgi:mono/diheme cytochrome c family protein